MSAPLSERVRMTLLFDFYGELLTEKQKQILTCNLLDDLSLSEIAELHHISPQAVRDMLKRTEKTLCYYESKLKLLEEFESG